MRLMRFILLALLLLTFSLTDCYAVVPKLKISNRQVKVTTGFTVNLTTNIPSTVVIKYGLTPSVKSGFAVDNVFKTVHHVDVNGLNFGTKYFYQIVVTSAKNAKSSSKILYYVTEKR